MIFPPPTYWPEIQRICRKYDVSMCADEIVGGFGGTGEWFSHQYFGFEPDTMSIAKGVTSRTPSCVPLRHYSLCIQSLKSADLKTAGLSRWFARTLLEKRV